MPKAISHSTRMYRPRNNRVISGVCAALAIRRNWNLAAVRILFLILGAVFFPIVEIIYWVAKFVIAEEQQPAVQSIPGTPTPKQP
jgi:phage shock protein PspC (stress-responsive transcriptional regulator)